MFENVRGATVVKRPQSWINMIPGLSNIREDIWREAISESDVLVFSAGTKLINCGDSASHFIIVLQGTVRVYQTADTGREICLYRVRDGQVCVLTLTKLMKPNDICAEAVAEEDVRLLAIPINYFHRLLDESADFRNYVMSAMADSLSEVMQMVADVSFQRLELRLACLIGKLSESRSTSKLKVTHQEVANELGTSREVVSRILKEFEHMGCIKLSRGRIEVLSGEKLQTISS